MPTIILNSTNIVNTGNNKLVYRFQGGGVTFRNNDIALAQMSLYYSWYNINASAYNNNTLAYRWLNGTIYTITIPDGYYSVLALNAYIQSVMVNNSHYLIDIATGEFVYFIQIQSNEQYYAIQLNEFLSPLPATIGVTYNYPVGATWTLPVASTTPQLIIYPFTQSNFGKVIGFSAGSYPATFPYVSSYSTLSNITPELQPISAVLITCSLITNPYATNSKSIYSFGIPATQFGQQIIVTPAEFTYNRITDGFYNDFTIEILDQNGVPIPLKDPQLTILLTIRDKGTNQ